ncbi:TPA: hypothetical protein QHI01_000910 [Staphylococcus aureus]|uniref:hypothetical protein n=1 Tax=Staphylococcus aureus TaxID=1280 RepID=UPI000A8658D8|nr:hypothetical protein [Staphylococcus aureus]MBU7991903.1 hypothetical protein [Staphylococcus aureus]HDT5287442.1 hypothetical protein [Staphylococcus aureus]HEN4216517.1 hypothetical protein [Staphylococcus aureus]
MGWGPNIEAGGKSAYNNVQVGVGPNIEAGGKSAYNNVQVGVGPNIKKYFFFRN